MALHIDPSSLAGPAQKIVAPGANPRLKQMAAKGAVPGVAPGDLLGVLVILSRDPDRSIAEQAAATLGSLPPPLLKAALGAELHPAVIDMLCDGYVHDAEVMARLLNMRGVDVDTVVSVARRAGEAVTELVATNQERLLQCPEIIAALYMNKRTRMSTADRIVELASRNGVTVQGIPAWKEAAIAIQDELVAVEPTEEPLPDDLFFYETDELSDMLSDDSLEDVFYADDSGEERIEDKLKPLFQRIAEMSVSQKVRRAMLGSKEERAMLVRESNKIVAAAAARSPLLQEPEVVLLARNRGVSEEVLRIIGMTPEWLKSYQVKHNLVENAKTPTMIAQRIIPQLREADLKKLAKNKNVSAAIQTMARRHLGRKK